MKCIDLIARCIDDKLWVSNNIYKKKKKSNKSDGKKCLSLHMCWTVDGFTNYFFSHIILGNKNFEWWFGWYVYAFFPLALSLWLFVFFGVCRVFCRYIVELFGLSHRTVCLSIFRSSTRHVVALNLVYSEAVWKCRKS